MRKNSFMRKLYSVAGLGMMALAAFIATPASTMCSFLLLDDVELPESLQIKE